MVWDPCRKIYVLYTPEEHVRQSCIEILNRHYGYPLQKIAVEREFQINSRLKRFDLLLFNKANDPFVLIECKAPQIPLDETVFEQISRYHYRIKASYLAVTNGQEMLVTCRNNTDSWITCEDLPSYL